jgi:hypothetical protein
MNSHEPPLVIFDVEVGLRQIVVVEDQKMSGHRVAVNGCVSTKISMQIRRESSQHSSPFSALQPVL